MIFNHIRIIYFLLGIVLVSTPICAQESSDDQHIKVVMRMIGDEILSHSGDSTSRVLAVEKEHHRYKIQFASDLFFNPDELVTTINQIVQKTEIANQYLIEVEECEAQKVVYSYEIGLSTKTDLIPCRTRPQPKACYKVFFTIISKKDTTLNSSPIKIEPSEEDSNSFLLAIAFLSVLILVSVTFYLKKRTRAVSLESNIISLGKYQFDKKGMILSFENKNTELSS